MYNDLVILVSQTEKVDKYGNEIPTYTKRAVFADVRSIGMREFYSAAQTDYKPECTAILADYRDYENEKIVLWNDEPYHVIRTYRNGKQLELTLETRIGDIDFDEEESEDESE